MLSGSEFCFLFFLIQETIGIWGFGGEDITGVLDW